MSSSQQVQEYTTSEVTNNVTQEVNKFYIKEYKRLGHGAFGVVSKAYMVNLDKHNLKMKQYQENKTSESAPETNWEGPFAVKRVLAQTEYKSRELAILKVTNHPNLIKLYYYFIDYVLTKDKSSTNSAVPGYTKQLYLHLCMECLPQTLMHEIVKYNKLQKSIPLFHIKAYSYQLLKGMSYLHSTNICHRDIKPSNVLIDPENLLLKICDFGSAKQLDDYPSIAYICSRFYRAPELVLGKSQYHVNIDNWSIGCVIGEMLLGKIVFQGSDPILQLREISKLLGPPDKRFVFLSNPSYDGPLFSEKLFSGSVRERFQSVFKGLSDENGIDLLMGLLCYDPDKRLSCLDAMCSDWFQELKHNDSYEGVPLPKDLFDFTEYDRLVLGESRLAKLSA
ncbi:Glycogen synthase kinase-3-like protein [Hanseniaspora uvarum DSM 2768]|nr:hypothetical protein FOG50_02716 [Hanseniaspora uvarum]KKA02251.1 Glycogen synthase kinase-3-like protein [Hanseniaspora uvarum DSM 2768]GMM43191.1 serine/threonine/tyrosine protein kinase [Hanseniaspora uvarum]